MLIKRHKIKAAEFKDLDWLDHEPISLADLKGQVVLLYFWDYSYQISVRNLVYLSMWHGRYAYKGLQIVAIHAPQFDFGKDERNLRQSVEYHGLPFPVANDTKMSTWDAYANRFWPSAFLIDRQGYLAACNFGEGGINEIELAIQDLLREGRSRVVMPKDMLVAPLAPDAQKRPVSPSLYFGYRRGRIGNDSGFSPDQTVEYRLPQTMLRDINYMQGGFECRADSMAMVGQQGQVVVDYDSGDVFLVAAPPESGFGQVLVMQDDQPVFNDRGSDVSDSMDAAAVLTITHPDAYHLVHNHTSTRHKLKLVFLTPGTELFCLDFLHWH